MTTYTPRAIKPCHLILDDNSRVSWWNFTLLVRMETGMNYSTEKLQNLQLFLNRVSTLPDKNETT